MPILYITDKLINVYMECNAKEAEHAMLYTMDTLYLY